MKKTKKKGIWAVVSVILAILIIVAVLAVVVKCAAKKEPSIPSDPGQVEGPGTVTPEPDDPEEGIELDRDTIVFGSEDLVSG